MTQPYILVVQIEAWPEIHPDGREGYATKTQDRGWHGWIPAEAFEKIALPMGASNDGTKITPEMVEYVKKQMSDVKLGEKTTVLTTTLINGFEVTESSSCVDPNNYDHDLGISVAKRRVDDKIWACLGFLLQCARNGFKK